MRVRMLRMRIVTWIGTRIPLLLLAVALTLTACPGDGGGAY
jgi:hypothetical protein